MTRRKPHRVTDDLAAAMQATERMMASGKHPNELFTARLWDSVVREAEASALAPAQRAELERRLADSIAHPEAVTPWEQVKARSLAGAKR